MPQVALRKAPILIQLPAQAPLVPTQGGALVPAATAAPRVLQIGNTGALGGMDSGPVDGGTAAASAPTVVQLDTGKGGQAGGALIATPHQAPVLGSADDMSSGNSGTYDGTSGSGGLLDALKKLGSAAGKGGSDSTTPSVPDSSSDNSSSGGVMDLLKKLFHGSDATSDVDAAPAITPPTAAQGQDLSPVPVQTGALPDVLPDGAAPWHQNDGVGVGTDLTLGGAPNPVTAPAGTALGAGPAQPNITANPTNGLAGVVDAPVPTPRPALGTDPQEQLVQAKNIVAPDQTLALQATPAPIIPQQDPDYFTRLKNNPLALALVSGGLGTMQAASRRGATPLGAIGEGGTAGLQTVFAQQAAQKEQDLAAAKEESEAGLRKQQGAFYGARTDAVPITAQAAATRADAATTNADAHQTTAGAAVTRANAADKTADAHIKFGFGNTGSGTAKSSVFQQKQQAWIASHPGDTQGALDYAAGHKKMGGGEALKSAYAIANSENNASPVPQSKEWVDKRAAEIAAKIQANDPVRAAPDAAPKSSGGALGGGMPGAAHPQSQADLDKLPSGALYINPADNKPYKKK